MRFRLSVAVPVALLTVACPGCGVPAEEQPNTAGARVTDAGPDSAVLPPSDRFAASRGAARCAMVTREGGPCVLWGPSLIELIARPELYDGKRVRVIGFVNFEFEGNGLYVSREDWWQSIYRNGVWIEPPTGFESDSGPAARKPNQRYVIVEATFRADRGGHLGMWSGTLERVTRLDPWGVMPPR